LARFARKKLFANNEMAVFYGKLRVLTASGPGGATGHFGDLPNVGDAARSTSS
jgi:hypothetical protein